MEEAGNRRSAVAVHLFIGGKEEAGAGTGREEGMI